MRDWNRVTVLEAQYAELYDIALSGTGGGASGTGDVTGPESSTSGNFASFADETGKEIADSGYAYDDFAASSHNHDSTYAPIAKGVTNGDSHDHNGGDGAAITEAALSLSDNTTANVSTSAHGFTPKAPNDTSKFLRGDATWAAVSAGAATSVTDKGANAFNLNFKVVNIGDWNMDSTADCAVAHGLTLSKILFAYAIIRNDDDSARYPLIIQPSFTYNAAGAYVSIDATNINLTRRATGTFDSTDFNATSYNRGFITFIYTD